MKVFRYQVVFKTLLSALLLSPATGTRLRCEELATPRIFGGHWKATEFEAVTIDANGNMLAGGYTTDETIYLDKLRPQDGKQTSTPILAYYPKDDLKGLKMFQIYIWPNELAVGSNGRVSALSAYDLPSLQTEYAVLLDTLHNVIQSVVYFYALILDGEFETKNEYEILLNKQNFDDHWLTTHSSIYSQQQNFDSDEYRILYICIQQKKSDAQFDSFKHIRIIKLQTVRGSASESIVQQYNQNGFEKRFPNQQDQHSEGEEVDVSGMSNFSGMFIGLDGTVSFGGSVLKPADEPLTGGSDAYYPAAMVMIGDELDFLKYQSQVEYFDKRVVFKGAFTHEQSSQHETKYFLVDGIGDSRVRFEVAYKKIESQGQFRRRMRTRDRTSRMSSSKKDSIDESLIDEFQETIETIQIDPKQKIQGNEYDFWNEQIIEPELPSIDDISGPESDFDVRPLEIEDTEEDEGSGPQIVNYVRSLSYDLDEYIASSAPSQGLAFSEMAIQDETLLIFSFINSPQVGFLVMIPNIQSTVIYPEETSAMQPTIQVLQLTGWSINQAYFGRKSNEIAFVGFVQKMVWLEGDQTQHETGSDIPKAFIIGMHSLCPVLETHTTMTQPEFINISSQQRQDDPEEMYLSMYYQDEVSDVDQEEGFGLVRLYDLLKFQGTQTSMETSKFNNTIAEDEDYEAPKPDEECLIKENFPFCADGKFYPVDQEDEFDSDKECNGENCEPPPDDPIVVQCLEQENMRGLCKQSIKFTSLDEDLRIAPNYVLLQEEMQLSYGMNSYFTEPWLACKVTQRFNNNAYGYIHGLQTTYNMSASPLSNMLSVGRLELTGRFTDTCYFIADQFELTAEALEETGPKIGDTIASLNLPDWIEDISYSQQSLQWATEGGAVLIKTSDHELMSQTKKLWLGSVLQNKQFYQSTIEVIFDSFCNDLSFYKNEPLQVVYVRLSDPFPFAYQPVQVQGISREIDSICRSRQVTQEILQRGKDLESDPVAQILLADNVIMVERVRLSSDTILNRIGKDETVPQLVINKLDEAYRMTQFRLFHYTVYSNYMTQNIWSTIEVRIICSVSSFINPLKAQPENIFDVISFDSLTNLEPREYLLPAQPKLDYECGYPVETSLQVQDSKDEPPLFLQLEPSLDYQVLYVSAPLSGMLMYSPKSVFKRYNLQIVYSCLNLDLLSFVEQDSFEPVIGLSQRDSSANIIDASGKFLTKRAQVELPFKFQLLEEGKEHSAPSFNQTAVKLPDSLLISAGIPEIIVLPPIAGEARISLAQDSERDEVFVTVYFDGQVLSTAPDAAPCERAACYAKYDSEAKLLDFHYPYDYLYKQNRSETKLKKKKEIPFQLIVPAFDADGNLVEVEAKKEEMLDATDDIDEGEKHKVVVSLDNGVLLQEYEILITIQNPKLVTAGVGVDVGVGEKKLEISGKITPLEQIETQMIDNIIEMEEEFDFLDWLDQRKSRSKKMYSFQSQSYNSKDVPWPKVQEARSDGVIEIMYEKSVYYRKCSLCKESASNSTEGPRKLADEKREFYNSESYREYLKQNKNLVVTLVPSRSQDNPEQLKFDWEISSMTVDSISISLKFENPQMVSMYSNKDVAQIEFLNTHQFMIDSYGQTSQILPSGYVVIVELPPQEVRKEHLLPEISQQQVVESSQTFVTVVPIISFVFNLSMQQLWGSIAALQIIAHIQILGVWLPKDLEEFFNQMIEVVTFDLFGFWIEDVNFGQTETEPFSENLNKLKYDSINILTNMFSLHVFILILCFQAVLVFALGLSCLKNCACCQKCQNKVPASEIFVQGGLRILLTGFLEIFLCSIIGLGIFELGSDMTVIDMLTSGVNIAYIVALAAFIFLLCWFVFWKTRRLVEIKETRNRLEHLQILKIIHTKAEAHTLPDSQPKKFLRQMTQKQAKDLVKRQVSIQMEQTLQRSLNTRQKIADVMFKQNDRSMKRQKSIDAFFVNAERNLDHEIAILSSQMDQMKQEYIALKKDYKKFEIFFAGRRLTTAGLSESFIFVTRRIIFVLTAILMVKEGFVFLPLAIFCLCSYLKIVYIQEAQPFIDNTINQFDKVNECFVLIVSYFTLVLLDISITRNQLLAVEKCTLYTMYLCIICNVLLIMIAVCKQFIRKIKTQYLIKRAIKKRAEERSLEKIKVNERQNFIESLKNQTRKMVSEFKIKLIECQILGQFDSQSELSIFEGNQSLNNFEPIIKVDEAAQQSVIQTDQMAYAIKDEYDIDLEDIGVAPIQINKQQRYRDQIYLMMGRGDDSALYSQPDSESEQEPSSQDQSESQRSLLLENQSNVQKIELREFRDRSIQISRIDDEAGDKDCLSHVAERVTVQLDSQDKENCLEPDRQLYLQSPAFGDAMLESTIMLGIQNIGINSRANSSNIELQQPLQRENECASSAQSSDVHQHLRQHLILPQDDDLRDQQEQFRQEGGLSRIYEQKDVSDDGSAQTVKLIPSYTAQFVRLERIENYCLQEEQKGGPAFLNMSNAPQMRCQTTSGVNRPAFKPTLASESSEQIQESSAQVDFESQHAIEAQREDNDQSNQSILQHQRDISEF